MCLTILLSAFTGYNVETLDPEVKILSLAIKSPGRPDIILPIPENRKPKGLWFTLKEDSRYSLKFTFQVSNNIVSGLRYTNTVWKTGLKGNSLMQRNALLVKESRLITLGLLSCLARIVPVDSTKEMLGTFSPQAEPYTYEIPEDTTPSGMFARGSYAARSKVGSSNVLCCLAFGLLLSMKLCTVRRGHKTLEFWLLCDSHAVVA